MLIYIFYKEIYDAERQVVGGEAGLLMEHAALWALW
jgi:hypothetical protein